MKSIVNVYWWAEQWGGGPSFWARVIWTKKQNCTTGLRVTIIVMLSNHWSGVMRQWKEDFSQSFLGEVSIVLLPRIELIAWCHMTVSPQVWALLPCCTNLEGAVPVIIHVCAAYRLCIHWRVDLGHCGSRRGSMVQWLRMRALRSNRPGWKPDLVLGSCLIWSMSFTFSEPRGLHFKNSVNNTSTCGLDEIR